MVEALDLAFLERDELRLGAGVLERLARLDELDLLEHVRGEDRDSLAVQVRHAKTPFWSCTWSDTACTRLQTTNP